MTHCDRALAGTDLALATCGDFYHWDPGVKRCPAYLLTFAGLESFCILEYLGLRGEDCLDERWAAPSTLQDQHSQTCLAVAALLVG